MRKVTLTTIASGLITLSLALASCGPSPTTLEPTQTPLTSDPSRSTITTTPTATATATQATQQKPPVIPPETGPKYGGTLNRLSRDANITRFDSIQHSVKDSTLHLTNQGLWSGDWTKGNAGGYGTKETDWTLSSYDLFKDKAPFLAESWKWTVDEKNSLGTIVYQIRQGVHWGLNQASEASRLVGGREMTADDVVQSLQRVVTDPNAYIYKSNPELRVAEVTKTGPWEVTVKVPLDRLIVAISRFGSSTYMQPPEVVKKYGHMNDWKNSVGTGPFILTDYVPGSNAVLVKNPNYWMKDPIGPGKGNQLPYLDSVRILIIPDASTQQAALRTAKIDMMVGVSWVDAAQMKNTTPQLKELEYPGPHMTGIGMRIDKPPFNDVRVRRALIMATDFKSIMQGLFGGRGWYMTWPSEYHRGYEAAYLSLDDPDCPELIKELYTYSPDKAKQLLKDAGYPSGFKTSVLVQNTDREGIDYFSIIKDQWGKVGVNLDISVKEAGAVTTLKTDFSFEGLATGGSAGSTMYATAPHLQGLGQANVFLRPEDPKINAMLDDIRLTAVKVSEVEALKKYRELSKYVIEQAYGISRPQSYQSTFWWPWLRNYSGEEWVGYFDAHWPQWVWIDQNLKASMGH